MKCISLNSRTLSHLPRRRLVYGLVANGLFRGLTPSIKRVWAVSSSETVIALAPVLAGTEFDFGYET